MPHASQWGEIELSFHARSPGENPYLKAEAWVDFTHDDGTLIRRPMFWDGSAIFRVRFSSTKPDGHWFWRSFATDRDEGLHGLAGTLPAAPPSDMENPFYRHGFWSIPSGGRNLIHADGHARLLCADTAWALPWRATLGDAREYALDRQNKGFNAALLMTVQPDMECQGPRSRTEDLGFDVGFDDLPHGTLQQLVPGYFQTFDALVQVLVEHGIAPVYQPVFHGYGWKGRKTAGPVLSPGEIARYCRYLVARYGARPAIWLIGGDGPHKMDDILAQLDAAGQEIEKWDYYQQPTGLHYAPHARNCTHQDKDWLDFQWCQTGHNGEHVPERVMDMWKNVPAKAVTNGEPTYEGMGNLSKAAGWWQGEEAWLNLTAGGTMGLVYGAASLWNWVLRPDEPDHQPWCSAPSTGWREAMSFEGSFYPGIAARLLDGLPFNGMEPNWDCTLGRRGLFVPEKLLLVYLPNGGGAVVTSPLVPRPYKIFDPRDGSLVNEGRLPIEGWGAVETDSQEPRVVIFCHDI